MQQTKLKISIGQRQQRIFMEIYQLRGFAAVAELGHLTRAAEKLHISQPALSAQIKSLEEELEVELFERTPNGMLLTAPGKRILAAAENVLAAAQALHNEARVSRGAVESSVTVGTVSDPEFIQLGALSSAAVERYPLLQIQFHREVSGEAFEHVREGRRDASFYYGELTHPSVEAGIHSLYAWIERALRVCQSPSVAG